MKKYFQSAVRRINQLAIDKKRNILVEKYPELFEIFRNYVESFHKDGGFSYSMQDIKVLQLLDMLIEKKAENIVEYGSGSTSLACAYYATNYNGNYLGLDESKEWAQSNNERLTKFIPNVKNAKIIQSDRIDDYSEDIYHSRLNFSPDKHFDFMLIDGPSFVKNIHHKNKANNDILKYKAHGLPETVIIDNRKMTVNWLEKYLGESHLCKTSTVWDLRSKLVSSENFQYYSLFEKKA